ncbi:MAG: prepilin-type N-terminal cleavage/methylation domain-containing protein [bacterium]
MKKKFAFTLIELLIVVAIIAILAAIAVPNFLEAQIRSKVSRVKADMRSVATGLEAYVVDHNDYPSASLAKVMGRFNARLYQLTTPTAYLTTVPKDPFRHQEVGTGFLDEEPTFEYSDRETAVFGPPPPLNFALWPNRAAWDAYYRNTITRWELRSPGPDRKTDYEQLGVPLPGTFLDRLYDPTNGTASVGDILRTNSQQL